MQSIAIEYVSSGEEFAIIRTCDPQFVNLVLLTSEMVLLYDMAFKTCMCT